MTHLPSATVECGTLPVLRPTGESNGARRSSHGLRGTPGGAGGGDGGQGCTEGQPSLDDPPCPWRLPRPTGGSLRTSHSAVVVPHRRVVAIHCLALALLRLADFRFGASSRICHPVTPFRGYRAVGPGTSLRVVWPRGPLVVALDRAGSEGNRSVGQRRSYKPVILRRSRNGRSVTLVVRR